MWKTVTVQWFCRCTVQWSCSCTVQWFCSCTVQWSCSCTVQWSYSCTVHQVLFVATVDISNLRSVIVTDNFRRFPQLLQSKVYQRFFHPVYQFVFHKSYLAYLVMFYNNVAVSSSAWIVSNYRTIINEWIAEKGYGSGQGLIWVTVTVFTCLSGENHENYVTITGMRSEIWTWNLQTRSRCGTATFDAYEYILWYDAV
jgi:hypothetical protein